MRKRSRAFQEAHKRLFRSMVPLMLARLFQKYVNEFCLSFGNNEEWDLASLALNYHFDSVCFAGRVICLTDLPGWWDHRVRHIKPIRIPVQMPMVLAILLVLHTTSNYYYAILLIATLHMKMTTIYLIEHDMLAEHGIKGTYNGNDYTEPRSENRL